MGDGNEEGHGGCEAILTGRLLLRRCMPADMPALSTLSAEHAVAENLCTAISHAGGNAFTIVERDDGAIVGCTGYGPTEDRPAAVEAGLWIGTAWWGRGYGTEAAQALIDHAFASGRINALWCSARVTNARARRVIEKCGFQFRGTGMVRSPTRFGAFPVERFVLDRRNWESLKAWATPDKRHGGSKRDTAA